MTYPRLLPCLFASQMALTLAVAQALPETASNLPIASALTARTAIHPLQHEEASTVQLWARGCDYKVSFHDGMTFIPYLGADYPHNQPFAWRTTSVRCGEQELLPAGVAPRLEYGGFRAEYQFGTFVEAYDVLEQGLEQTFVFAHKPHAAGDLAIRGAVQSLMTASVHEITQQDLVFHDAAGRPIVCYGRATAIDALGNRFAMTTSWVEGTVQLTLAAADVAVAQFPLTVDPLLSRVTSSTIGVPNLITSCDIAAAEGVHTYPILSIYSLAASGVDADVVMEAKSAGFQGYSLLFEDTSTEDSDQPRGAYVAGTDRWVGVWQALDSLGTRRIRIHTHDVDNSVLSTTSRSILNPGGVHDWHPDVGGTLAGSSPHALVVFQRESTGGVFGDTTTSTVLGALFDTSTTYGQFSGTFAISPTGTYDSERPSVNQQAEGGASFSWLCVMQQYNNSIAGDDWDLIGRRVDRTGTVAGGQWISGVGATSRHQLGPIVEGHDGRYAATFATVETAVGRTGTTNGRDIRLECFDWAHGLASPDPLGDRAPVTLYSNVNRVLEANGLAFDDQTRSHWLATFRTVAPNTPAAFYARCGYTGQALEGPAVAYNAAGELLSNIPATFERASSRFALHYHASSTTNTRVYGQNVVQPTVTLATNSGVNCANVPLTWYGPATGTFAGKNQLIGNRLVGIRATSQNAADLHFVVVALATADVPILDPIVGPGCRQLVAASGPAYIGILNLQIGTAPQWQLSLPESLGAMTLQVQDWIYRSAANQIVSTSRLTVPLVR